MKSKLIFIKDKMSSKIYSYKKLLLDIWACFFPNEFNYYSYLGFCLNIYVNSKSNEHKLLNTIFKLIDNEAKPKWCPRWFLRLLNLFGNQYIKNKRISGVLNGLLKGIRITNISTRHHNNDIKLYGVFPDPLCYWISGLEDEIFRLKPKSK